MEATDRTPIDTRPPLHRVVGWLTALWVSLWLVDSQKDWLAARLAGRHLTQGLTLVGEIPWWGAWVLLAPIAAVLAWRFPPTRERWRSRLPAHVVAGMILAQAHLLLSATLFQWRGGTLTWPRVRHQFVGFFDSFMMFDLIAYLGMVGGVAAWTYYRGMRHREREAVRLAVRSSELERAMSEARLESLRRQLDPHFLFNSLNTVAGLARRGEVQRVTVMLERLGDLLRLRLVGDQAHEITLERELAWMTLYLAIERERFGDRLSVDTAVPTELHRALVPAMLLQPLVENAVRHGIASEAGGCLGLRAHREGDRLVIEVTDSGPGFGVEEPSEGIGLSNTRARLDQLYGNLATLDVGNGGEAGGRVTIGIPWHTATDGEPER